ncbi:MAG: TonB-dependent receptor [Acidobacteria bacterium]|nr:TonB-dependent receptor [Acidobacteriota bacterium]
MAVAPLAGQQVAGVLLDPSDSAVPQVRMVLAGADRQLHASTGAAGEFVFENVSPGDYVLRCTVTGFEPVALRVRVGRREPRPLQVRLRLAAVKSEVSVSERDRTVALDADRNADAISVERTMLDNLPVLDNNYLSTLARFLDPGTPGGSGATIVVDGMEMRNAGVTASAIQEIRINNNPYTVEYPRWSRRRIEVITKSSADAYHGTLNLLMRDYRTNARDALAALRPREQRRILEGSLFGPVGRSKKTSFLLSAAREEEDLVSVVYAQGPRGAITDNVPSPQRNSVASLRISRQQNDKQAMFWQYNFQDRWQNNQGVGGTVLAEAGTQSRFREDEFIVNHRGLVTAKLLSQFRILIGRFWTPVRSNVDAPRAVVTDAFTGGGAQADRLTTEFHTSITWLLTQTAGRHTMKYGFNIPDWSRRGLSDRSNQTGTVWFATLADFAANRPFASAVQRGDPRTVFIEKNIGGFFQDEWQARPGLSVAAGVRYDWQGVFGDQNNAAPRLAVAWAPGKSRKTVVRTGAGFFFDRSGPGPVWDILRYDGIRLRRYVVSGPVPHDPAALPASVHRLDRGVELPNTMQFSAGIERQVAKKTTFSASYVGTRGVQQLRSRDGNAPLPPTFAGRPDGRINVLRLIESAGRVEGNALELNLRGDLGKRVNGMVQYVFGRTMTDTGGVNWFPASSFSPAGEWGRADTDRRHQFNFLGTASPHRWASFGLSASLLSGIPFNVTTGGDGNRDGLALDRPAGIARNTGRGPGTAVVDLRWYREFKSQRKKEGAPSVTLSVDAFNLLNRVNYAGFVGALSSPFFGRAVSTMPARRLQFGIRLQF